MGTRARPVSARLHSLVRSASAFRSHDGGAADAVAARGAGVRVPADRRPPAERVRVCAEHRGDERERHVPELRRQVVPRGPRLRRRWRRDVRGRAARGLRRRVRELEAVAAARDAGPARAFRSNKTLPRQARAPRRRRAPDAARARDRAAAPEPVPARHRLGHRRPAAGAVAPAAPGGAAPRRRAVLLRYRRRRGRGGGAARAVAGAAARGTHCQRSRVRRRVRGPDGPRGRGGGRALRRVRGARDRGRRRGAHRRGDQVIRGPRLHARPHRGWDGLRFARRNARGDAGRPR